ncbi:MAG: hypothetical protein ACLSA6_08630 [Holdemania massiliensis]
MIDELGYRAIASAGFISEKHQFYVNDQQGRRDLSNWLKKFRSGTP